MKLSIVIPTTNNFNGINKIVKEYSSNVSEVIVVGKGDYPGAKFIHSNSTSINELRKIGVDSAVGEYTYLVDRDDNIIMTVEEIISNLDSDIVAFPVICNDKKIKVFKDIEELRNKNWSFWNIICKSSIYKDVKFPNLKNTQDLIPVQMVLNASDDIKISTKPIYEYVIHNNSIQSKLNNIDEALKAVEKLREFGIVNNWASKYIVRTVLIKSIVKSKTAYREYKNIYKDLKKSKCIGFDPITTPMPFFLRRFVVITVLKITGRFRWKDKRK